MSKLQPVRGTHDLLPDDARMHRYVSGLAQYVAMGYGYSEIITPIFEFSEVFHRTLGETSDVVSKETYTFEDRGGESITLRPEFTASIARAFISNGLQQHAPCKFFYTGPAFRYERPQKGRQRQFHQIGVELLGAAEAQADIEVIAMAHDILTALGLQEYVRLELNSLGDAESRQVYREALVAYLQSHKDQLSPDSQVRLERNPLRILDSKAPEDQEVIANAPNMHAHFNDHSNTFFDTLRDGLNALGISYTINPHLVRGLDYYSHTVFEFTTDQLGAQGTVLAGGRYDGLIGSMGGPETPGIGWAAGLERLTSLIAELNDEQPLEMPRPIVVIPMNEAMQMHAVRLAHNLRKTGFIVEQSYSGNMKKRLKKADKINACAALIIGEDEITNNAVLLRDLDSSEQRQVAINDLIEALSNYQQ